MTIFTFSNYIKQNLPAFNSIKAVHSSGVHFNWTNCIINLHPSQYIDLNDPNLCIDTTNQRFPFTKQRIPKLQFTVKNPCPVKFKTIIVAQYNGDPNPNNLYIIDGQGRAISALAMGITRVPYTLVRFPNKLAMTSYFTNQNHNTNNLTTAQKHLVALSNPHHRGHNLALDLHRAYSSVNGSCDDAVLKTNPNLVDFKDALEPLEKVLAIWHPANKPTPTGQRQSIELEALLDVLVNCFTNSRSKTGLVLQRKVLYPTAEWLRREIIRLQGQNSQTPYTALVSQASLNLELKISNHLMTIKNNLQANGRNMAMVDYQNHFMRQIGGSSVQGASNHLKALYKNI